MNLDDLWPRITALAQVLLIDVTLAGDNAVVIGLAVAGLAGPKRRQAILIGVLVATVVRLGLALVAVRLITIVGLTLAGGLLLLWVCWRMARELRHAGGPGGGAPAPARFGPAIARIVVADLSMSLDNVLAVAGAAGRDTVALVTGLGFSVVLMAAAADLVGRLLERYRWIAWLGLGVVLFVALRMIWDGSAQVVRHVAGAGAA